MTNEQFNTLESVKEWMEKIVIHGLGRAPEPYQKDRINYLCGEFGLMPTDWTCRGCVSSRAHSLYNIYQEALKVRQNGTKES